MPLPKVEHRTDDEREKHNTRMKRYYANHPEQRQKVIEKIKDRYATDEAYRELVKERTKQRRLRLKETSQTMVDASSSDESTTSESDTSE
jgi:hypothetical protein